ncbi:hypothetical protein [Priestia filamentosa]|uniref:hypothetical protein n=1 Tax=Priestia filamentosa TaxID=1402861 RepID=UPI002E1F8782|nr:hypothetical protein [Priestia filamentosa]
MIFKDFGEFRDVLFTKREAGKVTCSMRERTQHSSLDDINHFVKQLGYQGLGNDWDSVDEQMARRIITYILSMDLAYDSDLDSTPIAGELCDYFISLLSSQAEYYTNAHFEEDSGHFRLEEWSSISTSTFDTGIIVVDRDKIGILWVEDED